MTNILDYLVSPTSISVDEEQKTQSRLILSLLLGLVLSAVGILSIVLLTDPNDITDPAVQIGFVLLGFYIVLYLFSRSRDSRIGIIGFILGTFFAFCIFPYVGEPKAVLVPFGFVPILITGMFFNWHYVAVISIMVNIVAVVGVFLQWQSHDDFVQMRSDWYFLIAVSVLTIVFVRHLSNLEHIRRNKLEVANDALSDANAKLRENEHLLETRVDERTADLEKANDELKVAWEAAQEADKLKSQFLASMSHELRTPMNAVLNFTEFVSSGMLGEVNDKQIDALDKANDSGKHLLALINDVLDITKIESGMMKLFVEDDIDLNKELETVINVTRTALKDKDVVLIVDVDAALPTLVGDRRRIRQVMINLMSNAAKFTDQGSITISAKRRNDNILLAIIDTGPGIPKDQQDLIFEPFKQTDLGIQQASGTGLGLPISQRLVEAHDGEIWLESDIGDGAAFYVRLPITSPRLQAIIE